MKTLSLQECKDKVARNYTFASGQPYTDWSEMEAMLAARFSRSSIDNLLSRLTEAYELYALEERKRTWEEACRAQALKISNETGLVSPLGVPLAEFKP